MRCAGVLVCGSQNVVRVTSFSCTAARNAAVCRVWSSSQPAEASRRRRRCICSSRCSSVAGGISLVAASIKPLCNTHAHVSNCSCAHLSKQHPHRTRAANACRRSALARDKCICRVTQASCTTDFTSAQARLSRAGIPCAGHMTERDERQQQKNTSAPVG